MDDIKIIESLEKLRLLIDSTNETVKFEIKKARWISWCYYGFYGCFIDSTHGVFIVTTLASLLIHALTRKGVMGAGKGKKS